MALDSILSFISIVSLLIPEREMLALRTMQGKETQTALLAGSLTANSVSLSIVPTCWSPKGVGGRSKISPEAAAWPHWLLSSEENVENIYLHSLITLQRTPSSCPTPRPGLWLILEQHLQPLSSWEENQERGFSLRMTLALARTGTRGVMWNTGIPAWEVLRQMGLRCKTQESTC